MLPIIYFSIEFLYQHYPDEDYWKIPHPPPLNYPNTEDTVIFLRFFIIFIFAILMILGDFPTIIFLILK